MVKLQHSNFTIITEFVGFFFWCRSFYGYCDTHLNFFILLVALLFLCLFKPLDKWSSFIMNLLAHRFWHILLWYLKFSPSLWIFERALLNQHMTCAPPAPPPPREDFDQPWQSDVFAGHSLGSQGSITSSCRQWRLWSDWVDTHADLRLRWAHRSFCWFCRALAHLTATGNLKCICMSSFRYFQKTGSPSHHLCGNKLLKNVTLQILNLISIFKIK